MRGWLGLFFMSRTDSGVLKLTPVSFLGDFLFFFFKLLSTSLQSFNMNECDYIIVGAGIGGLVLANRLSQDASVNVLLIEAGANRMGDPRIDTPGFLSTMYGNPDFDWDYMSVPQVFLS
jgi:hypothetical protein